MANTWFRNRCAKCKKPIGKKAIVVAAVNLSDKDTYPYHPTKPKTGVRVMFGGKENKNRRKLYHEECLPEGLL